MIAVGSDPIIYAAHMQSVIGKLQNKNSNSTANYAMHTFLKSQAGQSLQQGGDLVTAYLAGPLTSRIYTHKLVPNGSTPSLVLTMEGLKEVVNILPDQDESVKSRMLSLLQDHLFDQAKAKLCFRPATDEHCLMDREDYDSQVSDVRPIAVTPNMWHNCVARNLVLSSQLSSNQSIAIAEKETAVLKNELEHKEKEKQDAAAFAAALAAKDIALVKANAEKEALQKEIQHMREINELRMQLLRAESRGSDPSHRKALGWCCQEV